MGQSFQAPERRKARQNPAAPPWRWMLGAALALWAALASGQEPQPLEEVVVTATRLPAAWRQVPFAVSRVGQAGIQSGRQQLALDESLANVPGLFFQNRYNFAQEQRISIRGFGARANFGIRGIRLFADDIPLTMPDGQGNVDSIDLGSAESIEVLRGPASAVYGAAGGGAILIQSQRGPDDPAVSARFSAGSYDYGLTQLKAGGQFGALNAMASLSHTRLDGYREQSRFERTLLNTRFEYMVGERSSLTFVFNAVDSPLAQDPGALTAGEVAAGPRQAAPRNVLFDADEQLDQQKLGVTWRSETGRGTDLLLRAYAIRRDFVNSLPFNINANGQGGSVDLERDVGGVGGHWSLETAGGGGWTNQLLFGFVAEVQRDLRNRYVNEQGVRGELTTRQDEDVTVAGLFVENATDFGEDWRLSLGARLDRMEYEVTDRTGAGGSGETTFDELNPMAGLAWSPRPTFTLYGNIATSFDPPAFVELANPEGPTGFNQALAPQSAVNYEIGLKGDAGGRLRYELALFHIDIDDEILPFELTGSGQAFFRNAGRSTHEGLEAAAEWALADHLSVAAAYAWSDFQFDEYEGLGGQSFDGNQIPGVPRHHGHIALDWSHPAGLFAGADLDYTGSFYADDANAVETSDFVVVNLRAGYRGGSETWQWEAFAGVNNLLDEEYSSNIRSNAAFGRYYEPAPELNGYAGFELRFQAR